MLRQRALESFGAHRAAGFATAVALAFAASSMAAEPPTTDAHDDGFDAAPAAQGASVGADVAVAAGYAFRSVDAAVDDRAHGASALVGVDVGPLFHGFGARVDAAALAFPARDVVTRPLALVVAGPALTYAFDDGDVIAVARLGALGGVVVDGDVVDDAWGGSVGLTLRFRVGDASHVDVDVFAPFVAGDPRFGLQAAATLGLGIALDRVCTGLARGQSLAELTLTR